ncbi:MAG: phage protein Gp36 family protein [Bacteroidota bacterium]
MFLTKDELKSATVIEVVNIVINSDDTIVETIIEEGIDEMKSYLSGRFDVETIFSQVAPSGSDPDPRSQVVLKHLKKIVVDEIYRRKTGEINDSTAKGYNEAMLWLEKVAAGKINAEGLPPKPVADGEAGSGDGFIKYGGNTQYTSDY